MNLRLHYALLLSLFAVAAGAEQASTQDVIRVEATAFAYPDPHTGSAIGHSGGALLVAGGDDLGGNFFDRVLVSADGTGREWAAHQMSEPFAYSAAISVDDQLILIGGSDKNGCKAEVRSLRWDGRGVVETALPSMPVGLTHAGAGALQDTLYVVGGMKPDEDVASSAMYSLDLNDAAASWQTCDPIPGPGRLQPAVIGFYGELHVFGGFETVKNGLSALADAWGYRSVPLDGTTHTGWRRLKDLPESRAAAAVFQTGQTHVALAGGTTGEDPNEKDSDGIYIYHNVTDTWIPGGTLPTTLFAPVAVKVGESQLLVGGAGEVCRVEVQQKVKRLSMVDYGVMIVYFLLMAGIGVYFARKQTSSEEFALGSRNVKWWAAAISMFATGASSISFMAIPAQTFRTNLIWAAPVVFLIPLYFLQAYLIYPLLRRLRLTSTYEYLERRYHPSLRLLASFQCIAFQVLGRMSVVLLLPALAIAAVTGMDVGTSVLLMGLLTTVYTAVGGFEAVIWTDVTQGILMLFGALLMSAMAIGGLPGGFGEFVATNQAFGRFDLAIMEWDMTLPIVWVFILGLIMQNLAFAADQPMVQRVFATPLKDVRRLAGMFIFCSIAIAVAVNFAGLSIFSYFHAHPTQLDPTMTNDQVVPLYIVQRLPIGIAGLIVAALFAASMSTLSSSMNSVATLLVEDFYRRFVPGSTDRKRLFLMKTGSLVVGCFGTGVAFYMAKMDIKSMFQAWNEICALLGGGFIGIYILGMFTRRTSSVGAAVGAVASVICTIYVKQSTDLHWVFYGPAAVLSCLSIGYVFSLLVPSRRQKDFTGLTAWDMVPGLEETAETT